MCQGGQKSAEALGMGGHFEFLFLFFSAASVSSLACGTVANLAAA